MILEQLHTIKQFGCLKESDVTLDDIQKKEHQLGVYLPAALKEFYLTFHKDDPIFSSAKYFLPLEELRIVKKEKRIYDDETDRILVFIECSGDRTHPLSWDTGFLIEQEREENPKVVKCYIELDGYNTLEGEQFDQWLLWQIAYQQLRASPNILYVMGDALFNLIEEKPCSIINQYRYDTFLILNECNLFVFKHAMNAAYIAVPEEKVEQIEPYVAELGLTYRWDKRNGVDVPRPSTRPSVKKRPLHSIQPAVDLVLEFLHLPKEGLAEEVVAAAEERLAFAFPLPLREVYLQVPQKLLWRPDHLFSPEDLAWDEGKKLFFFAGDQGEPECAIGDGSPVALFRNQGDKTWMDLALLDSFLAGKLIWNAMNQEKLGTVLTEFPECSKRMLGPKSKLGQHLVSVLPNVTKGGRQQFYTTPAHDILVLRDEDMQSTYLASVGEEPLKRLEKETKLHFSWL